MKKVIMAVLASAAIFMAGCDREPPTVERMTAISKAVGKTAAVAVELSKTKQEVRDGIAQVLDIVSKVVPAENETFAEKWAPIVNEEVDKLVEAGKLSDAQAVLVKNALYVACDGIDLIFVRYPKAKEYQELVSAAVTGFCDGFNSVASFAVAPDELDADAMKYLKGKIKARSAK